jgi:hypothetical protein
VKAPGIVRPPRISHCLTRQQVRPVCPIFRGRNSGRYQSATTYKIKLPTALCNRLSLLCKKPRSCSVQLLRRQGVFSADFHLKQPASCPQTAQCRRRALPNRALRATREAAIVVPSSSPSKFPLPLKRDLLQAVTVRAALFVRHSPCTEMLAGSICNVNG